VTFENLCQNAGKVEAAVSQDAAAQSEALKGAFAAVMSADPALVKEQAEAMVARLQAKAAATRTDTEALILRINQQFPGDVGKNFSKVLYIVTLHSTYTRALTFENLFCVRLIQHNAPPPLCS
jgi:hypothetical protein